MDINRSSADSGELSASCLNEMPFNTVSVRKLSCLIERTSYCLRVCGRVLVPFQFKSGKTSISNTYYKNVLWNFMLFFKIYVLIYYKTYKLKLFSVKHDRPILYYIYFMSSL